MVMSATAANSRHVLWPCLRALVLALLAAATTAGAQVTVEILSPSPRAQDSNFRIGTTYGFSVSHDLPDLYRVYATTGMARSKWKSNLTELEDFLWSGTGPDRCVHTTDPRSWNGRCIESIGYFWKNIACGTAPCEWNGRWNAASGTNNISALPTPTLWPQQSTWGVNGFNPILNKDKVNAVLTSPPTAGNEAICQPHNLGAFATGTANAKVVQVKYADGTSRWFMAFNELIHAEKDPGGGDPNWTHHSTDKWRMLWATSNDGATWSIHPQTLFRSTLEPAVCAWTDCCGRGLLVTSMMVDNGYFYLTVTEVGVGNVYLLRANVNTVNRNPGYGTWQIAKAPNAAGDWTWGTVTPGNALDLAGLQAVPTFVPTVPQVGSLVRQSAITRVFTAATPGSASRYVALASGADAAGKQLHVFSSTSMTRPFQYESTMNLSAVTPAIWGLEFAFTHWPDNLPASPRIVASQLDLWIVEDVPNPSYPSAPSRTTVSRRTARVRGGIFGP